MSRLYGHPFYKTWMKRGVIPAALLLRKMGLLELSREWSGVAVLAIRLCLTEGGLVEKMNKFLDDASGAKDSDELTDAMWGDIARILHATSKLPTDGDAITIMDEDELEEHARTCTNPNCEIRKIYEAADKMAQGALKLEG